MILKDFLTLEKEEDEIMKMLQVSSLFLTVATFSSVLSN
jgi:hypothetical protein